MIKLLTRFRNKIDWAGYRDWDYTSTYITFDWNYNGYFSAFFTGVGELKKNILEEGKKYKISFDVCPYLNGDLYGLIQVSVGGVNQFSQTGLKEKNYSFTMSSVSQGTELKFFTDSWTQRFGIRNVVIEEIGFTSLDVFQDIDVTLNYYVKDIQEPENASSSYSNTFDLLGTDKNNRFFKQVFNINEDNTYNIAARCDAVIQHNDITIMSGYIKLESVLGFDKLKNYEITFYSNNAKLFSAIGDDKLSDLDWSDLDHTASYSVVLNSWTNFENETVDYVYPYIDYGYGLEAMRGTIGAADAPAGQTGLIVEDLLPAVRVKYILDKIQDQYGFTFEGTITGDTYFKSLIIPFGNKLENLEGWHKLCRVYPNTNYNTGWRDTSSGPSLDTDGTFKVYDGSSNTEYLSAYDGIIGTRAIRDVNTGDFQDWDFKWETSNDYYDRFNDSEFGFSTTHTQRVLPGTFKVLNDGRYRIKAYLKIQVIQPAPLNPATFSLNLMKINQSDLSYSTQGYLGWLKAHNKDELIELWSGQNSTGWINIEQEIECKAGDMIGLKSSNLGALKVYFGNMEFYQYGFGRDIAVEGNDIIPQDMKVKDFLLSLMRMYNLYLDVDADKEDTLILEHYNTYMDSSNVTRDWTHKIDLESDYKIELPKDYIKKSYIFNYVDGKDYWNDFWTDKKSTYDLNYGAKKIMMENEFIEDEQEIEVDFAPSVLRTSWKWPGDSWSSTNFTRKAAFTVYNQARKYPGDDNYEAKRNTEIGPRILFFNYMPFNDNASGDLTFKFEGNFISEGGSPYYPYAGHIYEPFNQASTRDINFESKLSLNGIWQAMFVPQPINEITQDNLYNRYWSRYIEELNNDDSRMLSGYFKLQSKDLESFQFNDKIFVDGSMFRVHKIENFDPTGRGLAYVELLKLDKAEVTYESSETATNPSEPPSWTNPYDIIIGEDNAIVIKENGNLIIGNDNSITATGITAVIGNRNQIVVGDSFVQGDDNILEVKGTIIGSDNISLETGSDDSVIIGESNRIIKEKSFIIDGVRFQDGEIMNNDGGVIDCGEDTVQTDFSDAGIIDCGENSIYEPDYLKSNTTIDGGENNV